MIMLHQRLDHNVNHDYVNNCLTALLGVISWVSVLGICLKLIINCCMTPVRNLKKNALLTASLEMTFGAFQFITGAILCGKSTTLPQLAKKLPVLFFLTKHSLDTSHNADLWQHTAANKFRL